eukprot:CAMPEP_0196576178 /NCGR_PEP_ID=MMETSP1081-20130531/5501_1 /TAXON_ID=36882 /ORGANISM="Pyramimonas amylifera, Strain CCMP720" /LENGTH=1016 /DNA_ID=CAMNT_0041894717 /DNA_START=240 /DNA_END=3290 /DNA_ORIENTATION=-
MTFGYVEFCPGTRLNLILGPNGTGKSSFVCAMCIGLAGKPSLLGRGDKVSEFIKRGEDFAIVEVTLCTGGTQRPLVISRKISKNNLSEWNINGQNANVAAVLEETKKLNVQLDNLCQFLPQDRVVAFSQLKPQDLLLETEKAIGDAHLFNMHSSLVTKRQEIRGLATRVREHESELERMQQLNKALERDADRINEKNRLIAMEEDLRKKAAWLRFEEAREQCKASKNALKDCKKLVQEKQRQADIVIKPLETLKAVLKKTDAERRKIMSSMTSENIKKNSLDEQLLALGNDAEAVSNEVVSLGRSQAQRESKLLHLQSELDALTQQQLDLGPPPNNQEQMEEVKAEVRGHSSSMKELQGRRMELREAMTLPQRVQGEVANRLRQLDDVKNQRLRTLASMDARIMRAHEWVQANRQRFESDVFGPILAEVHIESQQNAKYLEQHCPFFLWSAFVTTCEPDLRLLRDNLGGPFGVTVINYQGDTSSPIRQPQNLEMLHKYHITCTLDMVFEAPSVVKYVLNDHAGTARSFIGSSNTDACMEELSEQPGVSCVWTPSSQYMMQSSRYSNQKSSRVVETKNCRLFTSSAPAAERASLEAKRREAEEDLLTISQQTKVLDDEIRTLEVLGAEARRKQEHLLAQRTAYEKQRSKIQSLLLSKQANLQSLRGQSDERETQRLHQKGLRVTQQRHKTLFQMHASLISAATFRQQLDSKVLRLAELELQVAHLKLQVKSFEDDFAQLQRQYTILEQVQKEETQQALQLKEQAMRIAHLPDADLEDKFDQLPSTVEEVQEQILDLRAQVQALFIQDPNALREYEDRKNKIQALEEALGTERETLDKGEGGIDEEKEQWLLELRDIVQRMNVSFGASFEDIGCVGEVSLQEHQDFDKYEMRIRVKFRAEEQLQTLSSQRQSGGERSVSTMLYLIALQEFTKCPFRVVDEINQGMDAVNERKVFVKMVEAACRPDTPQCFLLTPKLLPQLEYSPAVTILNIMNGPRIKEIADIRDRDFKFYKPIAGRS